MNTRTTSRRRLGRAAGAGVGLLALAVAAPRTVDAAPCWLPPVVGAVIDPYREPPCRWCAGNRGIEYRVGAGSAVTAAATGRVEFVGTVVDVRYVVVRLPNGWRHTYGRLASTTLRTGDAMLAGGRIGRASGTFFFGLRIGDEYADPTSFIGELRGRPRLVPVDGTRARPAPKPKLGCPAASPSYGRPSGREGDDEPR